MNFDELRELAKRPESVTLRDLWLVLSRSERATAIRAALDERSPEWLRGYVAQMLVDRIGGFRLATVMGWDNERMAATAAKQRIDRPAILRAAIIGLHLRHRPELQVSFLDHLGLPHENGRCEEYDAPAASSDRVTAAADHLLTTFPPEQALYYLLGAWCIAPLLWPGLDEWLRRAAGAVAIEAVADRKPQAEAPSSLEATSCTDAVIVEAREPSHVDASAGEVEAAEPAIPISPPAVSAGLRVTSDKARLTLLDEHLIVTIIDGAQRVANSLSEEQIDVLLAEFAVLNGRRHQSFFLLGFRDVLFGRAVANQLAAANRERWRWYFAGYVVGLRRLEAFDRILELFDAHETAAGLGDTGMGPSGVAAHHVFDALCRAGRYSQATAFATVDAVYESRDLEGRLLAVGTDLLRREETALARPFFDLLYQALADRLADELPVEPKMWSDVRRRRAHCLRFGDNLEAARPLLEELRDDPDAESRAAVLTDIGLTDAGFRRLFELKYPQGRADVGDVCRALERGEPSFRESMDVEGASTAAHGHYAIGFLQLLRERYDAAVIHLEIAVAAFDAKPEVYSGGNLLVRARLHLALAICHSLAELQLLPRARAWILEAIRGGEKLPEYLITSTVEALSIADSDVARETADAILGAAGEAVLDHLARSSVAGRSIPIVDALLRRADNLSRSIVARVADGYEVLPLLLEQQRAEDAARMLDFLEGAARQGLEFERFVLLLGSPRAYHPGWDLEDARWSLVQCLESRGDYPAAARVLEDEFHQVLSDDAFDRLTTASEILDRLQSYGDMGRETADRVRPRYLACCGQEASSTASDGVNGNGKGTFAGLRVLVVGGDERQEQYDEAIRTELHASHGLQVSFLHSGWSSNWGNKIEEFERRLPTVDAVVFSRYMRTQFGRQARKRCGDRPWRGCGAPGKQAFIRSVLAAAEAARLRRQPRTH
jgi:hypothetical protein